MNLDYTRNEKIKGFGVFILLWISGALLIWIQAGDLMYPAGTKIVLCAVPLILRIVFDFTRIHKILTGEWHPYFR